MGRPRDGVARAQWVLRAATGLVLAGCVGRNPAFRVSDGDGLGTVSGVADASSTGLRDDRGSTSGNADAEGSGASETAASTGDSDPASASGEPADDPFDVSTWRFDPPEVIAELQSPERSDDPSVRSDRLEILFASQREGGEHIFASTRASVSDPWGTPSRVDALDLGNEQSSPRLSHDALTLVFSIDPDSARYDLYVTTRTDWNSSWMTPTPVTELNAVANQTIGAMLMPLGTGLYYAQSQSDTDDRLDIHFAERDSIVDPFSAGRTQAQINSIGSERSAWVDATGELMLFSTDRDGSEDLWWARHDGTDMGDPRPLPGTLNTASDEGDPWVTDDLAWLYFARDGAIYRTAISRGTP